MTAHIGIDPGKWKMGLAVDGEHVLSALAVRVEGPWTETAAVNAVYEGLQALRAEGADLHHAHVHIEEPRHYGKGKGALKVDVDQLEALAKRLKVELVALGYTVTLYRPSEWKGQVSKPVHHRRLRRAMKKHEIAYMEDKDFGNAQADVWDAVGLAFFGSGRTGLGGTRSGH